MQSSSESIYRQAVYSPAKAWRERHGRYRLLGSRCTGCGALFFPRRQRCSRCGHRGLEPYECSQTGRVVCGWSPVDMTTPMGYGDVLPRYVALIRLDDGVHIKAEVVDLEENQLEPALEGFDIKTPKEGLRVRMVIRKLRRESTGNWIYGYKFVPCENSRSNEGMMNDG